MAFTRQNGGIDFGETSLENIFIREFLPNADGDQLKVYIAGLLYTAQSPKMLFSDFAKSLGMTESYARRNFEYWEKLGLLQINKKPKSNEDMTKNDFDDDFIIIYNSIRSLVYSKSIDFTFSSDERSQKLAEEIVKIKGSRVNSREMDYLVDFVNHYENGYDIAVQILTYYYKDKGGKKFSQVEKLLEEIKSNGITDIGEVLLFASTNFRRKAFYKKVKKLISDNFNTTDAEESKINQWLDEYNLSEKEILDIVKTESLGSTNPSIKYLDKIIENKYRNHTPEQEKEIEFAELCKTLKKQITGTRYAVTETEKKIIKAWFEDLNLTDESVKKAIEEYSPQTKGATIKYIDNRIRNTDNQKTDSTQKPPKKNKKRNADRYSDTKLEELLLAKSKKKL